MTNTLAEITTWHQRARPKPTLGDMGVQLGCHLEEVVEMLRSLGQTIAVSDAATALESLADLWKSGAHYPVIRDREELLDSLADQIVTAVGVGHCANMDVTEACLRVNESNWSKFDALGYPIFNEHGKIAKGPHYVQPDLFGLF